MKSTGHFCLLLRFVFLLAVAAIPGRVAAQDRIGGHFGAVFPLVTHANGETVTIGDDFTVGFPMGVTVKTSDKWAFDLELVPSIQNDPLFVTLTVHPGVIRSLSHGYAAGLRMAFDVEAASWGFTPLLNKGFPIKGKPYSLFVEGVVPIRFQSDGVETHTSIGLGVHIGMGF
jgi:hypothetical protein